MLRPACIRYGQNAAQAKFVQPMLLQAVCGGDVMQFLYLSGEKACELEVRGQERLLDIRERLMSKLPSARNCIVIDVVLPKGKQLNKLLMSDPEAVVSSYFELWVCAVGSKDRMV